jgi:hypothetical protein
MYALCKTSPLFMKHCKFGPICSLSNIEPNVCFLNVCRFGWMHLLILLYLNSVMIGADGMKVTCFLSKKVVQYCTW